MKKSIGVVIILLTLVLFVIYRQLTHRPAAETRAPEQARETVSLLITI